MRMHTMAEPSPQLDSQAGPGPGSTFLRGHSGSVFGLDFMPDQRVLLSASADGTVRLWSTELAANLAVYRHACRLCLCFVSQQQYIIEGVACMG